MAVLGLDITVQNDDIVNVMSDLYVKTPEALARLLEELRSIGYEVEDLRNSEYRSREGTSVEKMEKNGWSLWFAKLPDIRRGKCLSCGSYISMVGIRMHGHRCEVCGEITYLEVIDGSRMRFEFLNERYHGVMFAPQLSMNVKRWDTDAGYIYFYREFQEGGLSTVTGDHAERYLAENADRWEAVEEDGMMLLKVCYPHPWNRELSAIEAYEIYDHYSNYREVKLWQDKEYREWDRLPIPETISIYESWHWAPIKRSPTIHERIQSAAHQTTDKGWHYQDGRPWYTANHWREMGKFIRHFTDLDADAYDLAWPRFRSDGPGGIEDLARFCHKESVVEDRPNMWNTVNAAFNLMEGKHLGPREIEAAAKGELDPQTPDFLAMLGAMSRKKREKNKKKKSS